MEGNNRSKENSKYEKIRKGVEPVKKFGISARTVKKLNITKDQRGF